MSKLRNFVIEIPKLCGARFPERWGKINEYVFDKELSDVESPFTRSDYDKADPESRMAVLFGFLADTGKVRYAAADQCKRLFRLAELSHYKTEHGDNSNAAEIEALTLSAVESEADFPEIAAVFTVDDALAVRGWNL